MKISILMLCISCLALAVNSAIHSWQIYYQLEKKVNDCSKRIEGIITRSYINNQNKEE